MPQPIKNHAGKTYGYLTVIKIVGRQNSEVAWLCRCRCGTERVVASGNLGRTISCGCMKRSALGVRNALRVKQTASTSPEYKSWKSMLDRCYLPSNPNFHRYGGRSITVCDEWRGKGGFVSFFAHIGKRSKGTSLDRKDSNGNYEPGNVQWATPKRQASNRRETPEYTASRKASLDKGRTTMWSDPELREKLLADRRSRPRDILGRILPSKQK